MSPPAWLGLGSPTRALGVRAALGWGTDAATRRRARSAIAAAALGILGIGAVVVVAASSRTTMDSPRAWGFGYDRFILPTDMTGTDTAELAAALVDDPDVGGLSVVHTGDGTLDGAPLELQQIEPRRGSALPVLLDGRAPIGPDEAAFGPIALREHDLEIGDDVAIVDGAEPVRIVGSAAVPAQEGGEFGSVVWLSAGGFGRLGVEPNSEYLYLTAAPGVPASRFDSIPGASAPFRPSNLDNLREIGAVPLLLAGFFALLGLGSSTHALVVAVRGRRHELAVLRSLGFVRRQVQRTVLWQGATTMLVALAIGAPAGLIAGTWLWRQLVSSLGTAGGVTVPVLLLVAVVVGGLVAAVLTALGPARRAGRLRAAEVLRAE